MPNFLREDYGIRNAQADTTAPASGAYQVMDIVENSAPALATPFAWVNISSGSPGTWVPVGLLQNVTNVASLTAAGNVAVTANIVNVSGSGAHNVTLGVPAAANSGTRVNLVNTSSGTITAVAATGTQVVGLATAATATSASFVSAGTSWYRV